MAAPAAGVPAAPANIYTHNFTEELVALFIAAEDQNLFTKACAYALLFFAAIPLVVSFVGNYFLYRFVEEYTGQRALEKQRALPAPVPPLAAPPPGLGAAAPLIDQAGLDALRLQLQNALDAEARLRAAQQAERQQLITLALGHVPQAQVTIADIEDAIRQTKARLADAVRNYEVINQEAFNELPQNLQIEVATGARSLITDYRESRERAAKMGADLATARARVQQLETQLAAAQEAGRASADEAAQLQQQIAQFQAAQRAAVEQADKDRAAIEKLTADLAAANNAGVASAGRVEELERELAQLRQAQTAAERTAAEQADKDRAAIEKLTADLAAANKAGGTSAEEAAQLRNQIAELLAAQEAAVRKAAEDLAAIEKLTAELAAANKAGETSASRIEELEQELTQLKAAQAAAARKAGEDQVRIEELTAQLGEAQTAAARKAAEDLAAIKKLQETLESATD
ncbi:MAG: hypothetical protein HYX48_07325, partial [Chlamydiales bacterium]|nr:hypothetical protein [Chlamydiales bacterium]